MYQQDFRANHRLQTILCQKTCLHRYIHCPYIWIRVSSSIVRRIFHRPTVRVIHLFEYHLSRTSSCIKITADANHRLSFSIFLFCYIIVRMSVRSSSIVRRIFHRPTVRVIHLFEYHLSRTSSCIKRLPRTSPALIFYLFVLFIFIVGHNSLSVCLHGHPSIVRSVFKLSRTNWSVISFISIIDVSPRPELSSLYQIDFRANHRLL